MTTTHNSIRNLIDELKRLPGIGEKSAQRLAYFIVGLNPGAARSIAHAILEVKEKVKTCQICYNYSETNPCPICSDPKRDRAIVCVIEDPRDLEAIERSSSYRGRYHVLNGVISPMSGIGPDELKIKELKSRVSGGGINEVIIATNPTKEGEMTAHYIQEELSGIAIKITKIAKGIPHGGDLEYIDPQTMKAAISNRRAF